MSHEDETGTIQAMLDRLNNERLPRLLEMKAQVDRGECLNEIELSFLEHVFAEANNSRSLLSRHPEFSQLIGKLGSLYAEVTQKALDNANKS
ncbi:MAG: hypothetical protein REI12_02100 [Pedobacter sp.]|nr:hypothetical protein [Pedobacter sp.]